MSAAHVLSGRMLTPAGWMDGELRVGSDGRIATLEGSMSPPAPPPRCYLLPGFIDLHVHGGGGADIMEGDEAALRVSGSHAAFGTTSLLATTTTAPLAELERVLRDLGQAMAGPRHGARILGVHLEGPYLNPDKLGAQPSGAVAAAISEIEQLRALAPLKIVTLAPEMEGHLEIIRQLSAEGIRVQLGHSLCGYEQAVQALEEGASGFTHLFNAMSGMHHREPGIVGAALAHAEYAELIPDLLHVHPGAIRVALRAIPRLYGVTDATAAAGMPDGEYRLGERRVFRCNNGVRLSDGTLAGSALTMDQALRNLVALGMPIASASERLSRYPAEYLGIADRGRLEAGAWADIVVLDRDLRVLRVFIEGESHEPDA